MSKTKSQGFGFVPEETASWFYVQIKKTGPVFLHQLINGRSRHVATFTRAQWDAIAQPVRAEFNRVLGRDGYTLGRWKIGDTMLCSTMGKELLLLNRAIEDCRVERIPTVLENWHGLHPAERWWLCTQSQACHQGPNDERKGWRVAIKYALGAVEE